ncbi:uncharacterized protein YjbJ (UPF0337 family) [Streptacidiphilus sp. MAP12-16]|uniref:CsbD family protein n=1 Tax=Streptacidiphilus sp. MAP12-16 TaxID=3156300 RepID=UPI0035184A2B
MSITGKIKAKRLELSGRIKQGVGRTTGNRRLKAQGRADRFAGRLRQSGERVKGAFKH